MQTKTKIALIAGGVVVIAAVVFALFARQQNSNIQNANVAGNSETSTGNGTAGSAPNLTTSEAPTRPLHAYTDPSQPYVGNLPRLSDQPLANNGGSAGTSNDAASNTSGQPVFGDPSVASMMSPDTLSMIRDAQNLSSDQLLQKNDPNYKNIISNGSSSGDGVVFDNGSAPTLNVPEVPGVDAKQFRTTPANTSQAFNTYLTHMSSVTSNLDVINKPNLYTDLLSNPGSNSAAITQQQSKVQDILNSIIRSEVPSQLIGLHEQYFDLYTKYNKYLADMASFNNIVTQGSAAGNSDYLNAANTVQSDMNDISTSISNAQSDIDSITNVTQNNAT